MLSHKLPAPVELEIELDMDNSSAVIQWADKSEEGDPAIVGYEVVAEMVAEDESGEEQVYVNNATFPASVGSFTVSGHHRGSCVRSRGIATIPDAISVGSMDSIRIPHLCTIRIE
jgi:hypothetical protein